MRGDRLFGSRPGPQPHFDLPEAERVCEDCLTRLKSQPAPCAGPAPCSRRRVSHTTSTRRAGPRREVLAALGPRRPRPRLHPRLVCRQPASTLAHTLIAKPARRRGGSGPQAVRRPRSGAPQRFLRAAAIAQVAAALCWAGARRQLQVQHAAVRVRARRTGQGRGGEEGHQEGAHVRREGSTPVCGVVSSGTAQRVNAARCRAAQLQLSSRWARVNRFFFSSQSRQAHGARCAWSG
jgi:hypothetical protein